MLSKLPIHTFLFSLFPIMFFFQGNLHEIPFGDVIFPLFLSISITFLSWVILRKFIGSQRSGLIISLIIMSFINLGNIRFFISDNPTESLQSSVEGQILVSILLLVNVIGIIYFLKKHRLDAKTSIANVVSMTMIGVLIFSITSFSITTADDNSFANLSDIPVQISDVENKPNIYFIILDEYAGSIQLKMILILIIVILV